MSNKSIILKYLKENIYFLKCNNISIKINDDWIKLFDGYIINKNEKLNDYNDNIKHIIKYIKNNRYVRKENYYNKDKEYLIVNTQYKIGLTECLINVIYVYIHFFKTELIDKFKEIIRKNIIYKKEYNPIFNPILCENIENKKEKNKDNDYENIDKLYFNLNLFYDLSLLNLNIKIKFDIINTLDKIKQIYIFCNEYYKIDIIYELDEGDFIKILEQSNIIKFHYNLKDVYLIYRQIDNFDKLRPFKLIDFKKTNDKYDFIFNEELIINC